MDRIDKKILMLLQQNAKLNTKEIAQEVGLTVTPTYERIKKIEEKGYIQSYVAILDKKKVQKNTIVYCQITLFKHQKKLIEDFTKKVAQFDEVIECHNVSGNFDFLLKLVVANMDEFQEFINNKLSVVDYISTIHSSFVMNSIKEHGILTL